MTESYPKSLLPHQTYATLSSEVVLSCSFIRETQENMYSFLDQSNMTDGIVRKIIEPQYAKEVFELSLFLYGYYDENHVGIRLENRSYYENWNVSMTDILVSDVEYSRQEWFPLFLYAEKLCEQKIEFEGKIYTLSFSHKPTRANFWHFQLWTKNSDGDCISRDKGNKRLARSLLERVVAQAIVFDKSDVKPFRRDDFDKAIKQAS